MVNWRKGVNTPLGFGWCKSQIQRRGEISAQPTRHRSRSRNRLSRSFAASMARGLRAPGSRHAILRFRWNAARATIWLDTLPTVAKLGAQPAPTKVGQHPLRKFDATLSTLIDGISVGMVERRSNFRERRDGQFRRLGLPSTTLGAAVAEPECTASARMTGCAGASRAPGRGAIAIRASASCTAVGNREGTPASFRLKTARSTISRERKPRNGSIGKFRSRHLSRRQRGRRPATTAKPGDGRRTAGSGTFYSGQEKRDRCNVWEAGAQRAKILRCDPRAT